MNFKELRNMKRKAILLSLFLLCTVQLGWTQPAAGGDLEAIRVGYITKKLNLTPDEAKQFWPVYDAYRAEMKEVRDDMRDNVQAARENFDTMTDQEVEAAVTRMLDNRRKELDITLRYHEQFRKVLNIRKIAKLYRAEHEFTQLLLQKLQERRENMGPGPGARRFQR